MKRLLIALLWVSFLATGAQAHFRWGVRVSEYGPYKIWGTPQVGYVVSYMGGASRDSCVWVYVSGGAPPDSVTASARVGGRTPSWLVDRANHSGTQTKSTISDFSHTHSPSDITGTAVITTDSRLSDARTPVAHNQAISTITALQESLNVKAKLSHTQDWSTITNQPTIPAPNDSATGSARTGPQAKIMFNVGTTTLSAKRKALKITGLLATDFAFSCWGDSVSGNRKRGLAGKCKAESLILFSDTTAGTVNYQVWR